MLTSSSPIAPGDQFAQRMTAMERRIADLERAAGRLAASWIAVTFAGTWANFGGGYNNVQYRKIGDIVYVRGLATGGAAAPSTICTLPAGFRPPASVLWATSANGGLGIVSVDSAGVVRMLGGASTTALGLDAIRFSTTT